MDHSPSTPARRPKSAFNGRFTRLTDSEAAERNPAISPDGKFVAFLSDRSRVFDIWLARSEDGSVSNWTQGRLGDVDGPLRAIGFSGGGSELWIRGVQGTRSGGSPREFLDERAAELAWSPDGSRLVYHTWEPGDPTFTADRYGKDRRRIIENEPGLHNHYQVWSKDGRWIYLVRGRPATRDTDLWRIPSRGGTPEQLTRLKTDVAYPVPIDNMTVFFVAHSSDGTGPWLWHFDLRSRRVQRFNLGLEQYAAIAASADGKRLAATVVNAQPRLWSVPIAKKMMQEQDVQAFRTPMARAQAPRFGGESLFYLSSRDGVDGFWRFRQGHVQQIWKGSEGAVQWAPPVSRDGSRVAVALQRDGKWQLHVITADGTEVHRLSADVDLRGSASWSPDGEWIAVAGSDRNGPGLFKLRPDGGSSVRIATGSFLDPVWSPRGDLIVYGGTQVFTLMPSWQYGQMVRP